jgi:hypothetical protein
MLKNTFAYAGGTDEIDTLGIGKSGTAGTLRIYPTTASKGDLKFVCADSAANYEITLTNASFGQAATLTIPDPGAATAKFALDGYTNVFTATQQINTLKIGASGTVGAFNVFPSTSAKGSVRILAADSAGDTVTTITNASQAGARTYTIPDAGASTANFALDAYTNVFTATQQINTLNIGASGTVGSLNLFSTTASKGKWNFAPVDNTGNTTMTITNTAQSGAWTYTIPDAGASASFVMTQGTQTITGTKTFATGVTFGASSVLTGDIGTGTCSSNAVTISNMAGTITTESLSTAGGANQPITVTNTLVSSTSVVLVSIAGGTNTNTWNIQLKTIPGSGSFVTTIYNNTAATSLNGTIILKFLVVK